MSAEPVDEQQPVAPRAFFADARAAKHAARLRLYEALAQQPECVAEPEPAVDDKPQLDEVRLAALQRHERKRALGDLFTGRAMPTVDDSDDRQTSSFDGGDREMPPRPAPGHDETLVRVIRERRADRGAHF